MKKGMLLAIAVIVVLSGASYFVWGKINQASMLPQKIDDARTSNNLDLVKDLIKQGGAWYVSSFVGVLDGSKRIDLDMAMCRGYVTLSREPEGVPYCKRTADAQSTLDKGATTWFGLLGKYTPQQVLVIASKVDTGKEGYVWSNIGHAYILSGNMEKAMNAYSNFIKAHPKRDGFARSTLRKDFTILSRLYPKHAKDFLSIEVNEIGFQIDENMKAKYPELIALIITTESMDKDEKEFWLSILPSMSQLRIAKLFRILDKEKKALEKLDEKYNKELIELNRKHSKMIAEKKVAKSAIHLGKYMAIECFRDSSKKDFHVSSAFEFKMKNNEYFLSTFSIRCKLDANGKYVPVRLLDRYDGNYKPLTHKLFVDGEQFRVGDGDFILYFSSDGKEVYLKTSAPQIKEIRKVYEDKKESLSKKEKRVIEEFLRNPDHVFMVRVSEKDDTLNKLFREFSDKEATTKR